MKVEKHHGEKNSPEADVILVRGHVREGDKKGIVRYYNGHKRAAKGPSRGKSARTREA